MTASQKLIALIVALSFISLSGVSYAAEPAEQLKTTITSVMGVIKDPAMKGTAKQTARREKVSELIKARFSYEEMAKRTLGKHWNDRTDKEKKEFTEVFTKLVEKSYIDKLETLSNDTVVFGSESVSPAGASVNTTIVTQMGTEIPVSYRLVKRDSTDWKVYDIVVSGVSLVNNFRSKFSKALSASSYEELVKSLRKEASSKKA
jgi:phospholipid transport system substrate-binding protein